MDSSKESSPVHTTQQEVSVKKIILRIQELWGHLLKKIWTIAIIGIIGALLGLGYAFFMGTNYNGKLTFVVQDSKGGGLSAYAGLASQFGFDLGSGGGSGLFSGENVLTFLKSRLMVQKALLSPMKVGDTTLSLADVYINTYNLRKSWKDKPELANLSFLPTGDDAGLSRSQDSILNKIYLRLLDNQLSIVKPDKKLDFIEVSTVSSNEMFSKVFTERLVHEAVDFYVETKTKRSKDNVDKLQKKADSIELLMNKKIYASAITQDLNMNPAKRVAMVGEEVQSRDKMILQTIYGEVVKNLEISKMSMLQETPIVQIVDSPILPLKVEKVGKVKGIILGGILGGILAVIYLLLRKLYQEVMQ